MTNRIPKQFSRYKSKYLELIYDNIAGTFPQSICGKRCFIFIVDLYTRINWIISLKHKSDTIALMKTWKAEVELATGDKIIAARTDNAPVLIQGINEWKSETRSDVTTLASSYQNGIAEWNIRTAEANMRAMLNKAGLPLEF
jgi:hypothetical protein